MDAYFALFAERCEQLQRLLAGDAFFGGASPAYCDFTLWHFWDLATELRPDAATPLPALGAWAARVRALPAVAAHVAQRPPAGPSARSGSA